MGKIRDLTGKRYGAWTVVSFDRVTPGSGARFFAKCTCGTVRSVVAKLLKEGRSKSCGCSIRKPPGESSRNSILRAYRRGAAKRHLAFRLTVKQFTELTSSPCYYCGALPAQSNSNMDRYMAPYIYNGIDRLNSKRGYYTDNCVACCGICNWMKRDSSFDDFVSRCIRIAKHRGGFSRHWI